MNPGNLTNAFAPIVAGCAPTGSDELIEPLRNDVPEKHEIDSDPRWRVVLRLAKEHALTNAHWGHDGPQTGVWGLDHDNHVTFIAVTLKT